MQPQIERLADHGVMHRRVHNDIHGHEVGDFAVHGFEVGEYRGPRAYELFGFCGRQLGVVAPDVAYGDQLYIVKRGFGECCQAV